MALTLVMLGDSIAYGQGASRPTDTVGARLVADLAAAGIAVELRVVAMPRARSAALSAQVERALARRADVAVIIVGANDLTGFVSPQLAAAQLGDALKTLRAAGTQVVVVPAPDLSAVPWVPDQLRRLVGAGCAVLQQAQIRVARAAGARVADVAAASSRFAGDASLFAADRFHPSSAGYALIAEHLAPVVRAAAADALGPTTPPFPGKSL
jgi:lysophospholipase L1-like esterase